MKFYDDDMDELFNKAGRDYPLKTEPKNWDAVRAALNPEDGSVEATQKRNGWRRLLPLLFLLLIPAVYVFIDKDNIVGNSQQDVKADAPVVTKAKTDNTNSNIDRISKSDDRINNLVDHNSSVTLNDNKVTVNDDKMKEGKDDKIIGDKVVADINNDRANNISNNNLTNNNRADNISDREVTRLKGGLSGPPQTGLGAAGTSANVESGPALWGNLPSLSNGFNSLNGPSEVISLNTPLRSLNQSDRLASVPNSVKKPTANNSRRKGPYIGVITAPDISTIKGQQIKGIGYSAGAIVGYSFNNRWQVEGGMMWSRKKYFTDGKYFDKKGPGIPDNVNLLWLNGGCEMFEFPIVARYNFSGKKNTFFGSAGLTSYLMKKEDYKYSAVSGAGTYPYEGYRTYDRSGDHLFANLQLSAGYNLSLSSKLNIRIEPYLKAPLKKIGIGKIPVTSTGLYFAITRDFR
jgi:hypothetical protein